MIGKNTAVKRRKGSRRMKKKRIIAMIALVSCIASTVSGCGRKNETTAADNVDFSGECEELTLPITKEPITVRYWCGIYGQQPQMSENEVYKEISKRTGINIEFINPPVGQDTEQFGLMLASKELPDLIERSSAEIYPGGLQKALDDGVYLRLNDYIDKYMPNLKKILEENSDIKKMMTLDSGDIGCVKSIKTTEESPWFGPIVRQDYLDKVGLERPETVDDWYNMLKAFKEKLNLKAPMVGGIPEYGLSGAFNVSTAFYQENGKVKYGPIESGYKEMLQTLNKWYDEGLIDNEFAARDEKDHEAMCISGDTGAWFGAYDKLDYFMSIATASNKNYKLAAAPYLVKNKGNENPFIQKNYRVNEPSLVISAKTKHPKEVAKLVDYFYSQDGYLLFNYGIEGKTYTLDENNEPHFTDFMLNNPDGKPFTTLEYIWKRHSGPYLRNWAATPSVERPEIQDAMKTWEESGTTDAALPKLTFTAEEESDMNSVMTNVNTYRSEFATKVIMGLESAEDFDKYTAKLKDFGIERVIGYYQAALERYNKR